MNILIVSHTYPPNPGVGGRRIAALKKYFELQNYNVFLVVNANQTNKKVKQDKKIFRVGNFKKNNNTIKRKSYGFLSFLKTFSFFKTLKEIFYLPDRQIDWKEVAHEKSREIILKHKINCLITSSLPHVAHFVGKELKKEFPKIKWIAELRDLWSQNHYASNNFLLRRVNFYYEFNNLKYSDALVTVSTPLVDDLRKTYHQKKISCITNGFEPTPIEYNTRKNKFSIVYTGILYEGLRDPRKFLLMIKKLIDNNLIKENEIKIDFYGPFESWLQSFIDKNNLNNFVFQNGYITYEESLKKQQESQLLLFINSNMKKDIGVYSAKIFEYLRSKRPILAIGNCFGVVDELLKKTKSGFFLKNDIDSKKIILELYAEFKLNGNIMYNGKENEINKFTYSSMTNKYIDLINKL